MFLEQPLTGRELPSRTLSLTFDDGPGIKTVELSRFLREEGVPATFFVVGEQAESRGDAIESLVHNSHTIGNHTYSHSGLCDLIDRGGDPVDELLKAERLIAAWARDAVRLFRPPYGSWSLAADGSPRGRQLANRLNATPDLAHYIGPVLWDISGEDYEFWETGRSAEECCAAYLEAIDRADRGIVLMHDSSEKASARTNNRAFETCVLLTPQLKSRGYRFISLLEIPTIRRCVADIAGAA